jgi:hypothetical protein
MIVAQNYTAIAKRYETGELKYGKPEKPPTKPGKPPQFQMLIEQECPTTFQLWDPQDCQDYPQLPFGIAEPLNPDPRKKTCEFSIGSQAAQAFVRFCDQALLNKLVEDSVLLWNKPLSAEEIERTYLKRSLLKDPMFGLGEFGKNGNAYNPTLRTHWYDGKREVNAEGKEIGCPPGIITPVRKYPPGTVITYKSVQKFDFCIPIVRLVGAYFTQGKWKNSWITEQIVWIPNQRRETVTPNVDLASLQVSRRACANFHAFVFSQKLQLPDYQEPEENYGGGAGAGAHDYGLGGSFGQNGGMIFGSGAPPATPVTEEFNPRA